MSYSKTIVWFLETIVWFLEKIILLKNKIITVLRNKTSNTHLYIPSLNQYHNSKNNFKTYNKKRQKSITMNIKVGLMVT